MRRDGRAAGDGRITVRLWNRHRVAAGQLRAASRADHEHLRAFLRTRAGVEAYLEPRTAVTDTTVVLVAADGEWTRRRIDSPAAAASLARRHGAPLYDAAIVGYPARMRAWTERRRAYEELGVAQRRHHSA